MLSRTAEYALRAALWLAAHPERPSAAHVVADATGIPGGYLVKVLQILARAGLVRAQPGPGGGFVLQRPPEAIGLLDLLRAVEPLGRARRCVLGRPAAHLAQCPLHAELERARAALEQVWSNLTLAQLLGECRAASHEGGGAAAPAAPRTDSPVAPRTRLPAHASAADPAKSGRKQPCKEGDPS